MSLSLSPSMSKAMALAVAVPLALSAASCAPQPVAIPTDLPADALVLRPGDSLLEHAERLTVSDFPATNLPLAMGRRLVELWAAEPWTMAAEDWLGGDLLPGDAAAALGFDPNRELQRWRCHPAVRLDLKAGRLELTHEQRRLHPLFQATGARELQWHDETAQLLFWWVEDEGALIALGGRAPGAVAFRYRPDPRLGLSRYERALAADDALPRHGSELLSRATIGAVDRPALAAPAPTTLRLELDLFAGDSLRVALAIDDLGLGWLPSAPAEQRGRPGWVDDPRLGERQLSPRAGCGDGVIFAVEVTLDGEVYPVWARLLPAGGVWHEETIDLSFCSGRPISLALITRPGRADSALFDHALWADLTVEGVVDGPPDRPHVVLLDLPGLSGSDRGFAGEATPRLASWASAAERWDAVTSPAREQLPGAASLLSGMVPAEHGVLGAEQRLPESGAELVARLSAGGYETLARTEGGHLVPELGFAGGFSRFDFQRLDLDTRSGSSWSRELDRLAARRSARPLFLFLSSAAMLAPGPEAAEALTQLDAVAGAFLQELDDALHGEPTLVVVTSDHARAEHPSGTGAGAGALGPALGGSSGSSATTGSNLGEPSSQATVPLLLRWPAGWRSSPRLRESEAEISTLDVAATILDLAGLQPSERMSGKSLAEH